MLQDQSIADLYPLLDECTLADAARLRRRLRNLTGGRGRGGRRDGRADRRGDGRGSRDGGDRRGGSARSDRSAFPDGPVRGVAAPDPRDIEQLRFDIDLARERLTRRRERLPRPSFEMDLPIIARREEIEAAIREHQVIVLCGETGSGKSTQLPKMCLSAGRGVRGMIGHTQPRRIAARSVAARLADELHTSVGREVGFKVRFGDRTGEDTFIKVMTDGILLAETQGDRLLEQYDTLIIDEAHERSLNIDFLLGYLRTLLERRRDLKVIVTSATIDPERFSRHFGSGGVGAPIIEVSGRTYPVEVRYRPLVVAEGEHAGEPTSFMGDPGDAERDLETGVLDAIDELADEGSGDVLVFLPGEREIREIAEALRKHHPPQTEILPLFARLSAEEQERVFKPHPYRRIVLATNVAETSLTVPGIRYVVDSGLARISRYSARTKVLGLPIEAISQASAAQRSGRCGRVAAGVAIRLYSEEDFAKRPAFTEPEILRTNLAGAILQMKALRLGEPERFPFVEAPEARRLKDGYETLHELGAIDEQGVLTILGERLSRLPVDPRIGRMVLAGADEKCLDDLLIIAAALSIQDPRDRPLDRREAADQAHRRFEDPASDFVTFLNIWQEYHEQSRHLSRRKLVAWCKAAFLSFVRMREWHETHNQLRALVKQIGVQGAPSAGPGRRGERRGSPRRAEQPESSTTPVPELRGGNESADAHERPEARATNSLTPSHRDAIHRALLTGLLSSVGKKGEQHEYEAPRQASFAVHPASVLFKHSPGWVMAAEVVQTTRRYARIVAPVEPGWIERAAGHLVRRTYSEAHWDSRRQNVLAFEKVLLFGLEVIAGRAVSFGPIDPVAAREVFIRHALVEGDLRPRPRFLDRNLALEEEVRTLEAKARRRDLLADAAAKEAFYHARVPEGVFNQATFDRWFKRAGHEQPRLLDMRVEDLLLASADRPARDLYPDELDVDGTPLAVKYRYEPGTSGDGLTLRVPLELLGKVSEQRAEWLVPGLLEEKVVELVRLLPKETRRVLGPAPGFATEFVRASHARGDTLVEALSRFAERRFGVRIGADQWRIGELPEHLRMNFQVVGKGGKALKESRRLGEIKTALRISNVRFLDLGDARYTGSGYRDWEFGDLPAFVEATRAGVVVRGYPAVVDEGETAGVRLCDTEAAGGMLMRAGLRRLYMLVANEDIRRLKKDFPPMEKVAAMHASLVHATGAAGGRAGTTGSKGSGLLDEVIELIADRAFFGASTGAGGSGATNPTSIRTRARFDAAVVAAIDRLYQAAEDVPALVVRILEAHHAAALRLEQAAPGGKAPAGWEASLDDVRAQVGALVSPGFLLRTPERWLRHVPRYLAGVQRRLDRLRAGGEAGVKKDRELMGLLGPWIRKYVERAKALAERGTVDPELETFRWMIEEYRVSLFAQDLGTSGPVSPKRLEGQFEKVRV
ncbi:MAG: ATP-dependent RNA helicase HrpA [Phycisphaerales bacterium]